MTCWDYQYLFLPMFLSPIFLPMFFKMITGMPVIALTDDYFINNYGGFSIEWGDIMEMHITDGNLHNSGSLIINLKHPEKYFNTPLKMVKYKIKQLFTANDISIPFNFVTGKKDEVFQVANAYWYKHDKKI